MRILFVSNFYPPYDRGGYEKHCHEIAVGLRDKGHAVHILTSRYGVAARVQEDFVTRSLFLEADLEHYSPTDFLLHHRQKEQHNIQMLSETMASLRPDLIVFWGMWNLSRQLPAWVEATSIPVAYWLEDLWPVEPDIHTRYWSLSTNHRVFQPIKSLVARIAHAILAAEHYPPRLQFQYPACGSRFLKEKLSAAIPTFRDAEVVMCGIHLEPFEPYVAHTALQVAEKPRLIYVGGLGAHKGVHTAIEAVARLKARATALDPQLTIIGAGHPNYEAQLRDLEHTLGLSGKIHFQGALPQEAVPPILAENDILIVPSIWEEPFGRVIVEGMAAGLVVVGTATGGSAEILVDNENGLVFPPGDAEALAECLLRLIQDPALYARLAHAGKKTSEHFDITLMIDGMEKFLLKVIACSGKDGIV
ncbi:MAG TPA: glycosyltransferase family 4 protein [Anaerolineae bacterium]|nr:glycosyltransferase family 4 protein [Anaerolineae bacterium]HQK13162.1 glycosyltransferase family 4 protein [Anaerolineae bacterium]